MNPNDAPEDLKAGVYDCEVEFEDTIYQAVMHFGPKSVGTDDSEESID